MIGLVVNLVYFCLASNVFTAPVVKTEITTNSYCPKVLKTPINNNNKKY